MTRVDICVPVYNEEEIIKKSVEKALEFCLARNFPFEWKIIIIDNGSTDNTEKISNGLTGKKVLLVREPKKGRGNAIKNYWNKSSADIVLYMDVDLAVSLDNLNRLVNPLLNKECELAIGSRLLPDSKIKRSFIRELSSQAYNFFSRVILTHNFSDMQCGFKAIRTDAFRKIAPLIRDGKWFFDTELIIFAKELGLKVKEIPVDWSENRYDKRKSKVNLLFDSGRFLINLTRLRLRLTLIENLRNKKNGL